MKTESVMMIKKSSAMEMIKELGDVIADENVLLKIVPDVEFNLLFGTTEKVDLDLDKETQYELMRLAHEKGITLDLLINQILLEKMTNPSDGWKLTPKAESHFEAKSEEARPVSKSDLIDLIDELID